MGMHLAGCAGAPIVAAWGVVVLVLLEWQDISASGSTPLPAAGPLPLSRCCLSPASSQRYPGSTSSSLGGTEDHSHVFLQELACSAVLRALLS